MIGVLSHNSHCKAILGRRQPGRMRWNFVVNHALGAGSITRPVGKQSSALPVCHGCLPTTVQQTPPMIEFEAKNIYYFMFCHTFYWVFVEHENKILISRTMDASSTKLTFMSNGWTCYNAAHYVILSERSAVGSQCTCVKVNITHVNIHFGYLWVHYVFDSSSLIWFLLCLHYAPYPRSFVYSMIAIFLST